MAPSASNQPVGRSDLGARGAPTVPVAPVEPVGGRGGPRPRDLLIGVLVFALAVGVSIVKPWGVATQDQASPPGPVTAAAAPSSSSAANPASVVPGPRFDPTARLCRSPSGWRVTSLERFAGQTVREWQTVTPVAAAGPADAHLPVVRVVSTSVRSVGWCAPYDGDAEPTGIVEVRAWSVPAAGAPLELGLRAKNDEGDLGADYLPPGPRSAPPVDWTPGRYVFAIEDPVGGAARWFAVQVVRYMPDGAVLPDDETPSASPPPG